jgi:glyoxylase-like metal-dependent hydrolase (beta-lactamase superfamily II)
MQLGDLNITPVSDGQMVFGLPPGAKSSTPTAGRPDFEAHTDYITADGRFLADLGAFLVRTGDRVVLIDAGMGPRCGIDCGHDHGDRVDHKGHADDFVEHSPMDDVQGLAAFEDFYRECGHDEASIAALKERLSEQSSSHGRLGSNLERIGLSPSAVTDVVLTHLHPDHIGWVSHRGRSYFSNATLWAHQADIDHFLGPQAPDESMFKLMFGVESTRERMAPVLNQVRSWDRDCTIAPGIDLIWLPGHTPGSSIAVVSNGQARAMILGDVIHCPLEIVDDEFEIMADLDPALARRSKDRVVQELEDPSVHASSTHFPGLKFGRMLRGEGRKLWSWS